MNFCARGSFFSPGKPRVFNLQFLKIFKNLLEINCFELNYKKSLFTCDPFS